MLLLQGDPATVKHDSRKSRKQDIEDVRPDDSKIPSREELDDKIKNLTMAIESTQTNLEKSRVVLTEMVEEAKKYTDKYGTIDNPTLRIRAGYTPPARAPARFTFRSIESTSKNVKFLHEFYEKTQFLEQYVKNIQFVDRKTVVDNLIPSIGALIKEYPELQTLLHFPMEKGDFVPSTPLTMMSGIIYCANLENLFVGQGGGAFDYVAHHRDVIQLNAHKPELNRVIEHRDGVMEHLDPVLRKIFTDYPKAFPRIIVHRDQKEFKAFLKKTGKREDVDDLLGFHDAMGDEIQMFGGLARDVLSTVAHECGHPLARTGEHYQLQALEKFKENFSRDEEYRLLRKELRDEITQLRDEQDSVAQRVRYKRVRELYDRCEVVAFERLMNSSHFQMRWDPTLVHTQLEEGVASLVQRLIIRELYADDPKTCDLMTRIADYENRMSRSPRHYGAFIFADEQVHANMGDLVSTINKLSFMKDSKELQDADKRIRQLNENSGIHSGILGFLGNQKKFDAKSHRMEITMKTIELSEEMFKREHQPEYPAELRRRIVALDQEVATLMRRYLEMTGVQKGK